MRACLCVRVCVCVHVCVCCCSEVNEPPFLSSSPNFTVTEKPTVGTTVYTLVPGDVIPGDVVRTTLLSTQNSAQGVSPMFAFSNSTMVVTTTTNASTLLSYDSGVRSVVLSFLLTDTNPGNLYPGVLSTVVNVTAYVLSTCRRCGVAAHKAACAVPSGNKCYVVGK